jgi:hypothetical protein
VYKKIHGHFLIRKLILFRWNDLLRVPSDSKAETKPLDQGEHTFLVNFLVFKNLKKNCLIYTTFSYVLPGIGHWRETRVAVACKFYLYF